MLGPIIAQGLGLVNSTEAATATFSAQPVGLGPGRIWIGMITTNNDPEENGTITSVTVDGTSATERIEAHLANGPGTSSQNAAIYSLALTSEVGSVDIIVGGSQTPNSWGLTYIVLNTLGSAVPVDTASATAEGTSSHATSTTLESAALGVAVACICVQGISPAITFTWESLMTERASVDSGGNDIVDHRHGAAFDILTESRSATVETVGLSSGSDVALVAATFE